MSDYNYSPNNGRPRSAHEISSRVRATEKKLALMVAEHRTQESDSRKDENNSSKGLFTSLLASLRIF